MPNRLRAARSPWFLPLPSNPETPLLLADLVETFSETGGGVRSYLRAKSQWFSERPGVHHVTIVPGSETRIRFGTGWSWITLRSPRIPGCDPYRYLLPTPRLREILLELAPSILELGSSYSIGPMAQDLRARRGTRLVGFLHTDYPDAYVRAVGERLLGRRVGRWLEARARGHLDRFHSKLDATVVAARSLQGRLPASGAGGTHRISLGVDLDIFRPDRRSASLRSSLGLEPDAILCTFAGRLDGEKRIPLLLEAYRTARAKDPRLHLLLIGEGPLRPAIEAVIPASPGLHLLPFVPGRIELATHLASSDLYLSAGPHETFALSVLEAQACGLPVLGVDAGALRERVAPGTGLLVPPERVDVLSAGILALAGSDLAPLREAARRQAVATGGWNNTFGALESLYHNLVGASPPAAIELASPRQVA